MIWMEMNGAEWSWVEKDGAGWRWVHGLVISVILVSFVRIVSNGFC